MTLPRHKQTLIGDRHRLGHSTIDSDHFAIGGEWLRAMRAEPAALPLHIARLRKLMRRHFESEAALVEEAGVRFCECHRQEHNAMLDVCDDAYFLARRNWKASQMRLRELPKLVRNHIICMDQIAVLIIDAAQRERAARPPPAG